MNTSPKLWTTIALLAAALGAAPTAHAQEKLQLLRNGSFGEDEMSLRGEPGSSCGGNEWDQYFNQQDLFPDGWSWVGVYVPAGMSNAHAANWPRPEVTIDKTVHHAGGQSIRLETRTLPPAKPGDKPAPAPPVVLQQTFEWNTNATNSKNLPSLANLYREPGADGKPTPPTPLLIKDGLHQDMVLEGWFRTNGVPADAKALASLSLSGAGTPASFALPTGTNDWQHFEVHLNAADLNKTKAPGANVDIQLSFTSLSGAGQVWFADLSLTANARPEPNLLPNASFEEVTTAGHAQPTPRGPGSNLSGAATPDAQTPYPAGWTKPANWVFLAAPYYYVWNNWQHFFTDGRGTPRIDNLVSHSGQRSLRFDLYGGDEYSTDSAPMVLNQAEARPIEVTAWVRADRLRNFDLQVVDQDGTRLNNTTVNTFWGGQVSGTHDWIAVRNIFQPSAPLKSIRLRICGRGFNALTETDIGVWHAYNQVSTMWVDDVGVREIYSTTAELAQRGVKVPAAPSPAGALHVVNVDLGERLWGENQVSAVVRNDRGSATKVALEVQLTTPAGADLKAERGDSLSIAPGQSATISAPYVIHELSPNWRKPGRMRITLLVDGKAMDSESYGYGTWPVVADVRPSKAYIDETENPILVAINLGIAKKTLAKVKDLKIEVVDRRDGRAVISQEVKDVPAAIATAHITDPDKDRFYFYTPRAGLLDHRNLILQEMDISKLPARPWNDPEADFVVRVSSKSMFGEIFPTSVSHPFGKLTKFNEVLEPIKEVTVDPVGHFFRVNGKPFFVMAQSHINGAALGGAPPSRSVVWTPAHAKDSAMNGVSRWQGTDFLDGNPKANPPIPPIWAANLYGPMILGGIEAFNNGDPAKVAALMGGLNQGQIMVSKTFNDGRLLPLSTINDAPAALCYFNAMDEAEMEVTATPAGFKANIDYADALHKVLKRPVGVMDNHSQFYPWHDDDHYLDHFDALYMEREEGSLWRPGLTLRNWMKRSKSWVLADLPQTYENVPHERERYRTLVDVMQGSRGWFGIQGCADPSLYRELGGELRHEFTYLSANEGTPEVKVPEGIAVKAWKKGDRVLVMAEQHNPVPRGRWSWETIEGKKAHTGVSRHLTTPIKNGYAIHGYNDDIYREIAKGDSIRQEVYIPAENKPQAIFLIIPGNGDFNHIAYWGNFDYADFPAKHADAFLAGECYSMAAYGINWYRGGAPTWAAYEDAHRFPPSCLIKMGDLPPAGWNTLTVPLDKLALDGRVVDGLMFMTSGGEKVKAWWGKSLLVRATGKEETMLDGRIGRDADNFNKVVFNLPGMKDGTVRVVGEDRTVKMTGGQWADNLHGEMLYDSLGDGYLGDGITYGNPVDSLPESLELSYSYDASPRCIRVYEVMPGK